MNEQAARARALELITFADGINAAQPLLASRSREVAGDLIEALDMIDAERSARQSIQAQRDHAVNVLGRQAHEALDRADNDDIDWS